MITIARLTKTFGSYTALKEISLDIKKGELLALLGPSGCGKTTLLRIIAGLDYPDSGSIFFNGADVTYEAPQARKIGFVFQHFALFRHMTVFDNIAFGLTVLPKQSRPSKEEIREKVTRLLKLIQMEWLADAYPGKLSGGQRQRVALARALAIEPGVLLLDEPFSSLDATVRRELRRWLKRLHDELHITSIFVTHDQEEALEVANRVVVMNKGTIEQIGTPEEVYDHPTNRFVYHFLGDVNIFEGRLRDGQLDHTGAVAGVDDEKAPAVGLIRPHEIELTTKPMSGTIPARVLSFRSAGPIVRVELSRVDNNETVTAEVKKSVFQSLGVQVDSRVYLIIEGMKVFVDEGAHI